METIMVRTSVIQQSSARFIKKFYYKASDINYVALKLRFAEPPSPMLRCFYI